MVFTVNESEWKAAEFYFAKNPNEIKFERYERDPNTGEKIKKQARAHSFICINNIIYALPTINEYYPAYGTQSIVKKGMTKEGKSVAIKITFSSLLESSSHAYQTAVKEGLLLGQGQRTAQRMSIKYLDEQNIPRKVEGNSKIYTVMENRGICLFDWLYESDERVRSIQLRRYFSLLACTMVQELHCKGILHCDLKAENFTILNQDGKYILKVIDMDFSLLKDPNVPFVEFSRRGTPGFVCPQILEKGRYSEASDIYALATALLIQFDLAESNDVFCNNNFVSSVQAHYKTHSTLESRIANGFDSFSWFETNYKKTIEPKLRKIFINLLNQDANKRSNLDEIILYLCERLREDLKNENRPDLFEDVLRIELQTRLKTTNAKPPVEELQSSSPSMIFSEGLKEDPKDIPDQTADSKVVNRSKLQASAA